MYASIPSAASIYALNPTQLVISDSIGGESCDWVNRFVFSFMHAHSIYCFSCHYILTPSIVINTFDALGFRLDVALIGLFLPLAGLQCSSFFVSASIEILFLINLDWYRSIQKVALISG